MGFTVKNSGGNDFELAPAGNHVAICYSVTDLGFHEKEWQGTTSMKRRVRVSWELCNERMKDGRPFSVSKEYTASLSEKANLRHDLESWRGRPFTEQELAGFDVFNVLDKPCMVNVVHQAKRDGSGTYARVAGVATMPKGIPAPPRQNDLLRFSWDEPDAEAQFARMPEWLQKRINRLPPPDAIDPVPADDYDGAPNDDIPF